MGNPLVAQEGVASAGGKGSRGEAARATDIAGVRAFRPRVVPMIYDIWRIVTRGTRGAHLGVVEAGAAADGGERRRPVAEGLGSRGGR
jgi:hypothetical protein